MLDNLKKKLKVKFKFQIQYYCHDLYSTHTMSIKTILECIKFDWLFYLFIQYHIYKLFFNVQPYLNLFEKKKLLLKLPIN